MLNGIAHVSFLGGGIFLPSRTPYDRQVLVEQVTHSVRAQGRVQVLIDDQRWLVQRNRGPSARRCARCSTPIRAACCSIAGDRAAYCLCCAFENSEPATAWSTNDTARSLVQARR